MDKNGQYNRNTVEVVLKINCTAVKDTESPCSHHFLASSNFFNFTQVVAPT